MLAACGGFSREIKLKACCIVNLLGVVSKRLSLLGFFCGLYTTLCKAGRLLKCVQEVWDGMQSVSKYRIQRNAGLLGIFQRF